MRLAASALVLGILALSRLASAQDHRHEVRQEGAQVNVRVGTVRFPASASPAAQRAFVHGIGLLHSFAFDAAARAFRDAERADSTFALPYWFEALTHSPVLWGIDDAPAGRRVLARLAPSPAERLAKAATPRERAYGAAVEAFYADTDLATRLRGYADSLSALARRDTADLEAAAFASIAQQMYLYAGSPAPAELGARLPEAIGLAQRVFAANPLHPGAAHYLIHVSDLDASFALTALPAAYAYARIAPDVEHAQHMPSHVFLKLGLWDDQVAANERAWHASLEETRHERLPNSSLDFHDFRWLEYGYLQQGRWRAARALIDSARRMLASTAAGEPPDVDAYYIVPMLQLTYAMETDRWTEAPRGEPARRPIGPASTIARERSFMRMVNVADATGMLLRREPAPAWIDSVAPADPREISRAALQLQALRAEARGDTAGALDIWRRAAVREDSEPSVGPPSLIRVHERIGALLLASGRASESAREYERALRLTPNRSPVLLGLARARAAAGDSAGAALAYRRLLANWHAADRDLPALAEVRRGAAAAKVTTLHVSEEPLVKRRVIFRNGPLYLEGFVYKPAGRGPFPAVLWNHGSEQRPGTMAQFDGVAQLFVPRGYVVFAPTRRGHDESDGVYIRYRQARAEAAGGQRAGDSLVTQLLRTEQLDDQLAGLAWLEQVPFVDPSRVVVAGCSFGGIQTLLAAARAQGLRAAVPMSPGAIIWNHNAPLRQLLLADVSAITIPVFLIQPPKDVSLAPSRELGPEFERLHKNYRGKVYPDTIPPEVQRHCFGGARGDGVWSADVLAFIDSVLVRR